jgi:hypothetical protein
LDSENHSFVFNYFLGSFGADSLQSAGVAPVEGGVGRRHGGGIGRQKWCASRRHRCPATRIEHGLEVEDGKWRVFSQKVS